MNIKVGDRVKFLNDKGGGVVTKVIDTRMVTIAVEGGFEIPTMISELILMEQDEPGARFFDEKYDVALTAETEEQDPGKDERLSELSHGIVRNRKSEDIYLAFVPHDQKWLITGLIDVFLINNTSCDLLYNYLRKTIDEKYEGIDYGSLYPDSKLLLDTMEREEIGKWTEGYLQFLFHKNRSGDLIPPFNSEVGIKGAKFYNEASYKESPFIEGKGIVVKILSLTSYLESRKEKASDADKKQDNCKPGMDDPICRHQVAPREAEVDLHIHELVEDSSNLEKSEILDFQKSYFIRCLESAIANHFLKVTFIHGVGNGVLREAILEVLKNYKGIEVFDAPMQKYGVGAVELRIPQNYNPLTDN